MRCSKFSSGLITIGLITLALGMSLVAPAIAAEIAQKDLTQIERLAASQGRSAEEVATLLATVSDAGKRGLPQAPLLNKVKEGLAKGIATDRIAEALRDLTARFEAAQTLLREIGARPSGRSTDRIPSRATQVLADALGRHVSAEEVRELNRLARQDREPPTAEALAYGAKGLAVLKDAGVSDVALIAEGLRQGYRPLDFLQLGREIRRHRDLLADNQERIRALQRDIERGVTPGNLFHDAGDETEHNRAKPGRR